MDALDEQTLLLLALFIFPRQSVHTCNTAPSPKLILGGLDDCRGCGSARDEGPWCTRSSTRSLTLSHTLGLPAETR